MRRFEIRRSPRAIHSCVFVSKPAKLGRCCAQVVAETLKMLLVSLSVAALVAPEAQAPLLALFIPLLIEAAAPEAAPRTPALADVAVKLITHLASGPMAADFKQSLAALPPSAKQRLQVPAAHTTRIHRPHTVSTCPNHKVDVSLAHAALVPG